MEPMKDTTKAPMPEIQRTSASRYCELRLLNHDFIFQYLIVDVPTEEVARMIDQSHRFGDQLLRWGMIYRACMDSGIFAPIGVTKFWEMLNNVTTDLGVQRATFAKGVVEFDMKERRYREGHSTNPDDITFINSKVQLQNRLKELAG